MIFKIIEKLLACYTAQNEDDKAIKLLSSLGNELQKNINLLKLLGELYSNELAATVRIQYGGSVKPANAQELLHQKNIDGALIGGASLKVDSFADIIKTANSI